MLRSTTSGAIQGVTSEASAKGVLGARGPCEHLVVNRQAVAEAWSGAWNSARASLSRSATSGSSSTGAVFSRFQYVLGPGHLKQPQPQDGTFRAISCSHTDVEAFLQLVSARCAQPNRHRILKGLRSWRLTKLSHHDRARARRLVRRIKVMAPVHVMLAVPGSGWGLRMCCFLEPSLHNERFW